jgi:hypothetical protein
MGWPELLESGMIFLKDNGTLHCHHDVQSLLQAWKWEVLAHFLIP